MKIQVQQCRNVFKHLDANCYFLLFIIYMQAVVWNLSAHIWCEHFPRPSIGKLMLKTVQRTIVTIITIITIVVFVVIFDDDTYYLLGLLVLRTSLLSLYKVRWSVTAKCKSFFIAKCCVIIKWDSYYKVRQFHHKVRQALQRATIITMWGRTNTRIFLYVQKKPSSETIQFTTAILFCFTSLTFSRISFGIRTFATLNLSFKRTNSVSSRPWTAIPQE